MNEEEKYQKPGWEYYFSVIFRKITGIVYSYPEFMFLFKILVGLLIAFLAFTIFRRVLGLG